MGDITRELPNNEYQAAVNSNLPTAGNPFATIADLSGLNENFANTDLTLTGDRLHEGDGFDLEFSDFNIWAVDADDDITLTSGATLDLLGSNRVYLQVFGTGNIELQTTANGALILPTATDPTSQVTTPLEGMLKGNTTSKELEYYDGTSWVGLGGGGSNLYTANGTIGTGRVATITDTLTFTAGDFKIEGLTDPDLFFLEESSNSIGIGTASPSNKLNVVGGIDVSGNVTTSFTSKFSVSGNSERTIYSEIGKGGTVGLGAGTVSGLSVNVVPKAGTATYRGIVIDAFSSNTTINYGLYSSARNGSSQIAAVYGHVVSETVAAAFGSIAVYAKNQGGAGNSHYGVRASTSSAGTNSWAVHGEATGVGTNNYGGYFRAVNAANNYAIIVPSGGGNVGIGTITPASMLTANGDVEVVGGAFGVIFEDRTTGQRTRWFVDNGTFQQENA